MNVKTVHEDPGGLFFLTNKSDWPLTLNDKAVWKLEKNFLGIHSLNQSIDGSR